MKRNVLIFCLLFSVNSLLSFSQETRTNLFRDVNILKIREGRKAMVYSTISGSPYYTEDFVAGLVFGMDTAGIVADLRYDMFQDEIEFKQKNDILWLNKTDLKLIKYGNEQLIIAPLSEDKNKLSYFFRLNEGKYQLLIRRTVKYYPSVPPKAYSDPTPERFETDRDEPYLRLQDQSPVRFNSKKVLLAILGDKPEIENFMDKEKIKVDKIPSLLKLFEFLNKNGF